MPFRYRILALEPDAYYSDFFRDRLEDQLGFDPTNTSNVAYTQYNKPYATFQYYGGFGLEVLFSVLPVAPQPGDSFSVDIQNITTNSPAAVFNGTDTIWAGAQPTSFRVLVGMPSMRLLGPGVIDVSSSFTSVATNTIYILQPKQITLVLP